MPEQFHDYQDDDLFNPDTAHESSDVPVRPLWWSVILFIVFAAVTHFVLFWMYKAFVKSERARMDPPQTQVVRPANADIPQNQPLLQPFPHQNVPPQQNTPVTDLVHMRATEHQTLHTYGWIDKQRGVVRIPIEQAKQLLVARSAVAVATPATTTTPTTTPTTTTATTTEGAQQ